jgi:hypothetical protein
LVLAPKALKVFKVLQMQNLTEEFKDPKVLLALLVLLALALKDHEVI